MTLILKMILKNLFDNKKYLSRQERKIFIDISYCFITDYFSRNIFSINQTCKDGVDRGGVASSIYFIVLLVKQAFQKDVSINDFKRSLDTIEQTIFFDAILNKERNILEVNEKALRLTSFDYYRGVEILGNEILSLQKSLGDLEFIPEIQFNNKVIELIQELELFKILKDKDNTAKQLQKIIDQYKSGLLTEEEFISAKKKILK